jgi:hypothetical protein
MGVLNRGEPLDRYLVRVVPVQVRPRRDKNGELAPILELSGYVAVMHSRRGVSTKSVVV